MAKGQTKQATSTATSLGQQAQAQTAPIISGLQSQGATAQANQANLLGEAESGYKAQQATGGYDPSMLATLRANTANLASTGGYDAGVMGDVTGGYSKLSSTGGFTPEDRAGYLNQATSGVKSTYDILAQQSAQNRAKTGGLGAGGDISQMARQLSQQQASSTLNAQQSLNQQVVQNQLAGLGGLASTQGAMAGAKAGGVAQQAGVEGSVASGSNMANAGLASLYNTTTGQVTALGQQVLQGLGLSFATQADALNALTTLSKNPGLFQTFIADETAMAGAAMKGLDGTFEGSGG